MTAGLGLGWRMITIYCALYQEAQGLISAYRLKKETARRHFQVFSSEEQGVRVVVTGVGAIAAAAAVAEISTCYLPERTDLLLNFGSCAGGEDFPIGQMYLCHKLTEEISGRTFYPDVLYQHPFSEAEIVSTARVMDEKSVAEGACLYDMEAAAIYQAGSYYYGTHQMIFLKAVTDHGFAEKERGAINSGIFAGEQAFTLQVFEEKMEQVSDELISYINTLRKICDWQNESVSDEKERKKEAQDEAKRLGEALHFSVTMQAELSQLLFYWKLTGVYYDEFFETYKEQGRLPAKDKREGKRILEELKARLL